LRCSAHPAELAGRAARAGEAERRRNRQAPGRRRSPAGPRSRPAGGLNVTHLNVTIEWEENDEYHSQLCVSDVALWALLLLLRERGVYTWKGYSSAI